MYISSAHFCKISDSNDILFELCKKDKIRFQKICIHIFANLSLSFLHSSNKMSFSSEILQKWEELIYVWLPKISDLFVMIYYFFEFFEKSGSR